MRILAMVVALGLAGCVTTGPLADLSKFTAADVNRAIVMASAATDAGAPYRLRCYTTLIKYVAPPLAATAPLLPAGLVSGFELAAELDAKARGGTQALIPADVHADCAVLEINAVEFAARLGAKVAPIPGASAVGGLLR